MEQLYLMSMDEKEFEKDVDDTLIKYHPTSFIENYDLFNIDIKNILTYELLEKIYYKLIDNKHDIEIVTAINGFKIVNKIGYINTFIYLLYTKPGHLFIDVIKYTNVKDMIKYYSSKYYDICTMKLKIKSMIFDTKKYDVYVKKKEIEQNYVEYYMKKNYLSKITFCRNKKVFLYGFDSKFMNGRRATRDFISLNMIKYGYLKSVVIFKRRGNMLYIDFDNRPKRYVEDIKREDFNAVYLKTNDYYILKRNKTNIKYPHICCLTMDKTFNGRQLLDFPLECQTIDYYKHIKKDAFNTLMAMNILNNDIITYIIEHFL